MDNYDEIYGETNYLEEERIDDDYQPEYRELKEYHHNEYPSGYGNLYLKREINPRNNNRTKMHQYYNYYTESSLPYNKNYYSNNNKYNTPDRIKDFSHFFINERANNNFREEYFYPINNPINIKNKIYKGNQTPQPFIQNNDSNNQEEYIVNYQYHEIKNIKDKRIKKYDSITHVTGYSNLIPLNIIKKNLYGKNYQKENKSVNNYKLKRNIEKVQELQKGKRQYEDFLKKLNSNKIKEEEMKLKKLRIERLRQEEELKLEKIKKERIKEERRRIKVRKIKATRIKTPKRLL